VTSALPLAVVATSLVAGLVIFTLPEEAVRLRTALNLGAALAKVGLVVWLLWAAHGGEYLETRLPLLPDGTPLLLQADPLSLLFVTLSALLWLLTTIYAIGYLEGSPHRSRFFGFFGLCVSATSGVALAGNLPSFVVFYELLTLVTYPLVVHRGTERALAAGRAYLAYTLAGGAALLLAAVWLHGLTGPQAFARGGYLAALGAEHDATLRAIFVLLVAGLGVKTALVPLHGWLPQAMVAPAPVSALLHAVAVVKAGAFGIVRVVYEVYGIELAQSLGLLAPLAGVAAFTIVYGSVRALAQDDLKRRLAFSTVSQVSYIVLGVATFGPLASVGGLVHLVHQGLMKITLFFCAGNLAESLGIHKVSEIAGAGRRMPLTMAAFTIGALGMIGVPPVAGFVSKWYLGTGALAAGQGWVIAVLAASSLLNAGYFLPVLYQAWFRPQQGPWPDASGPEGRDAKPALLWPALLAAAGALGAGALAGTPASPLEWARLVALREYLR
jgi:multicomponent Na+:H+ antiporter subunit D